MLLIVPGVRAQMLRGIVADGETAKPLYPAMVVNLVTEQAALTDFDGNFSIATRTGDTLSISMDGYRTVKKAAVTGALLLVELFPLTVRLREYVVHDLTPFQKDSIEMTMLYSKELNKKAVKPGFSSANGGGITGLIGTPVQRMSKSYKRNKRFKENFKRDLEQKYIDTRYTPALVGSLTGLTGDTLAIFMNTYRMEYSFARRATELELKMWIREQYKKYNAGTDKGGLGPGNVIYTYKLKTRR